METVMGQIYYVVNVKFIFRISYKHCRYVIILCNKTVY